MASPLINRLVDELNYPLLNADNFDAFIKSNKYSVLFCTEQPARFPESNDVAVILPELVNRFSQLTPAVVSTEFEKKVQGRYNFNVWPTLVFLNEGRFLGCISKVQDWDMYGLEIQSILGLEPRRDPGIGIPVVVNPSSTSCGQ
ncbi:hypothetical protein [Neptuniibacter pectenicola]|uniref:hypothetical protein n=1 Tax=Neptuniibacter pectenicola TaxID=1806669 RepID=UPI0030ED9238|tara:strand:- start:2103 stop:2534 length:432 start_codon:yes stop_codon:yes gene_type:complete